MSADLHQLFNLPRQRRQRRWRTLRVRGNPFSLIALLALPAIVVGPPLHTYATTDWGWSLSWRHHAAWQNCATARHLGLAPARSGQPGYWPKLDADSDGVACEPYFPHPAPRANRPFADAHVIPLGSAGPLPYTR
jgi:hypothetical protein